MTPYMFFKTNAGFSYKPDSETPEQGKRRCARSLARAEREAQRKGIRFEWQQDDVPCDSCACGTCKCDTAECAKYREQAQDHETLGCIAYVTVDGDTGTQHGTKESRTVLASLWGICGATDSYRRVVEAELAQEALARL